MVGPGTFVTPDRDLDLRTGRAWTTRRKPGGERLTVSGIDKIIDRPDRLDFTRRWRQPDGSRGPRQ
jgi:uncharacterized protein YndB with AHSA1/START domain